MEHRTRATAEKAKNGKKYYELKPGTVSDGDMIIFEKPAKGTERHYRVTGLGKEYKKDVTPNDLPTYEDFQRAYVVREKSIKADGSVTYYNK